MRLVLLLSPSFDRWRNNTEKVKADADENSYQTSLSTDFPVHNIAHDLLNPVCANLFLCVWVWGEHLSASSKQLQSFPKSFQKTVHK